MDGKTYSVGFVLKALGSGWARETFRLGSLQLSFFGNYGRRTNRADQLRPKHNIRLRSEMNHI